MPQLDYYTRLVKGLLDINKIIPNLSADDISAERSRIASEIMDVIGNHKLLNDNEVFIIQGGNMHYKAKDYRYDTYVADDIPYNYYSQNLSIDDEIIEKALLVDIYGFFAKKLDLTFAKIAFYDGTKKKPLNIICSNNNINLHFGEQEFTIALEPKKLEIITQWFYALLSTLKTKHEYTIERSEKIKSICKINTQKSPFKKLKAIVDTEVDNYVCELLSEHFLIIDSDETTLKQSFHFDNINQFFSILYLLNAFTSIIQFNHWYFLPSFQVKKGNDNRTFGTLVFNTKEKLSDDELDCLLLVTSEQWKLINTIFIDENAKVEEWSRILDELTHHNHHTFGAFTQYQDDANNVIKKNSFVPENIKLEFNKYADVAKQMRSIFTRTNDFLLAINKIDIDENIKLSLTLQETIKLKRFNLSILIKNVLNIIDITFNNLGFTNPKQRERASGFFRKAKEEIVTEVTHF